MKRISTLFAILFLFTTYAQDAEIVNYELNTHQKIQSLRLSVVNCDERNVCSLEPIGNIHDSIVCLHLNPFSDYELLVNNTVLIHISSNDIQDSLIPEGQFSQNSIVAAKNWIISEE